MFDETNLQKLFASSMIEKAKDLLAGYGWEINPKGISGYIGFKDCYTILTSNKLAYPWIAPVRSAVGFKFSDWQTDKTANEFRCRKVYFDKTYD